MTGVVALTEEEARPLRHAVLRPDLPAERFPAEADPPGAFFAGVREQGRVVAVGAVMPTGHPDGPAPGDWRVRGMAVAPAARGRGLGGAVLAALLEHARAQGATRVWCNARTPARTLYERAGLRVEGEVFELPAIGPHLRMSRSL